MSEMLKVKGVKNSSQGVATFGESPPIIALVENVKAKLPLNMASDEETTEDATPQPRTPQEWKKWKQERKALNRKRREKKLIRKLEKQRELEKEKEIAKKQKVEDDTDKDIGNEGGRRYTVSIALPGSILDNAQSPELRTYLAGQIARAAVIFNIDEIIIFDESGGDAKTTTGDYQGVGKRGEANVQIARILQYLECPQYLRKAFFPQHKDLKFAGLLNPLDCPHHMRAGEEVAYREGVVLNKPNRAGQGSFVNVGLYNEVQIDKVLTHGLRVTVKMDLEESNKRTARGKVVSPAAPRLDGGLYWGYSVRLARTLGSVFTDAPYKGGYDCLVGTSERGQCVDDVQIKPFSHLLVVFGGLQGLEASLDADHDLHIDDPAHLFHHYINVCPQQGSRTIRTEEAILIALSSLRPKIFTKI